MLNYLKQLRRKHLERSIAKNQKTVQNPKAIREERVAAIEFFKNLKDVTVAVPALLKRFEYSLDHGINDTREKESAMEGVLAFGDKALVFVKDHLIRSSRIAWPIKIFHKIGTERQVIEALEACLYIKDFDFDRDKIDKNYDILCYLRDYALPDKGEKLSPLLEALDERVRFGAAEVLITQDSPVVAEKLEHFLFDTSAENTRVHQAVVEAFLSKGWTIRTDEIPSGALPPGLVLNRDRRLVRS